MAQRHAASPSLMSAPALRALADEILGFGWSAQERGRRYAIQGRVGLLVMGDRSIGAAVRGSQIYQVSWAWERQAWRSHCTCPVGPSCKHAFALACAILAHANDEAIFDNPRVRPLLPVIQSVPHAVPGAPASSPHLATVAPPRSRRTAIEQLRTAHDQHGRVTALTELLAPAPGRAVYVYDPLFTEILADDDADLRCWRLARAVRERTGGWLPPALGPYYERDDLARREMQRSRGVLAERLVQWADERLAAPTRRLRLVLRLEQSDAGRITVHAEARLTTPRLTDAPRTLPQLRQVHNESLRNPGMFAPEEALLLDFVAGQGIAWFDDVYGYRVNGLTPKQLRLLLVHINGSPLASWDTTSPDDLAGRGGVTPGSRVRLRPESARLLPVAVADDGDMRIALQFVWPDGEQRALSEVLYFDDSGWGGHQPGFVLANGAFSLVAEAPPEHLVTLFKQAGELPLGPAERPRLIGFLASRFPHLQQTLDAHTRFHPTTPAIVVDLRPDDWLQVRLFAPAHGSSAWRPGAAGHPDAPVFEYTPQQGWVPAPAAEASASPAESYEAIGSTTSGGPLKQSLARAGETHAPSGTEHGDFWCAAPDRAAVEPAMRWLQHLQLLPGTRRGPGGAQPSWEDRANGWWLLASRKRMETFAAAWEERPRDVTYFGNERARRLLAGARAPVPQLRVTATGLDWFNVSAEWKAEGLALTDADWTALRSATTRFVKLSSGWVQRDESLAYDETMDVLADLGIEPGPGQQRVTMWQLAGAKEETWQRLAQWGGGAEAQTAVRELRERVAAFDGLPAIPPPPALRAVLRPYQQRGLDFLTYTASLGIGAVLADDMGLGKTVEALAWLVHLHSQDPDGGPSLVVCPASVVHNWAREAERFAPHLRVLLLTSGRTRHAVRGQIASADLIVTNYALLRRDRAAWQGITLRALIFDEAQQIKNPDAAVTHTAQELRAQHRVALTGTPLENRALDLWSIVNVVNPGYLGNRAQFERRYDRPDAPLHTRTLLAAKLRPILLRRTKQEVAPELPERIEERLDCELTKGQRQLYLAELRRSRTLVSQLGTDRRGLGRNKLMILAALMRLRQICCHPALAGGKRDLGSGKVDTLFELLEPLLAEGHKVLLFSQFVQCLTLLAGELRQRDIAYHTLTGATTKRAAVVDAFQNDPNACVFLVSLRAGGTGLNLTAASYVILFDPWWNPAVEAQAIDRTHRIGQDRTVIAYRLLTRGTIEEKIWDLQQRKRALIRDVLGEDGFARTLTRADLDYLLADV